MGLLSRTKTGRKDGFVRFIDSGDEIDKKYPLATGGKKVKYKIQKDEYLKFIQRKRNKTPFKYNFRETVKSTNVTHELNWVQYKTDYNLSEHVPVFQTREIDYSKSVPLGTTVNATYPLANPNSLITKRLLLNTYISSVNENYKYDNETNRLTVSETEVYEVSQGLDFLYPVTKMTDEQGMEIEVIDKKKVKRISDIGFYYSVEEYFVYVLLPKIVDKVIEVFQVDKRLLESTLDFDDKTYTELDYYPPNSETNAVVEALSIDPEDEANKDSSIETNEIPAITIDEGTSDKTVGTYELALYVTWEGHDEVLPAGSSLQDHLHVIQNTRDYEGDLKDYVDDEIVTGESILTKELVVKKRELFKYVFTMPVYIEEYLNTFRLTNIFTIPITSYRRLQETKFGNKSIIVEYVDSTGKKGYTLAREEEQGLVNVGSTLKEVVFCALYDIHRNVILQKKPSERKKIRTRRGVFKPKREDYSWIGRVKERLPKYDRRAMEHAGIIRSYKDEIFYQKHLEKHREKKYEDDLFTALHKDRIDTATLGLYINLAPFGYSRIRNNPYWQGYLKAVIKYFERYFVKPAKFESEVVPMTFRNPTSLYGLDQRLTISLIKREINHQRCDKICYIGIGDNGDTYLYLNIPDTSDSRYKGRNEFYKFTQYGLNAEDINITVVPGRWRKIKKRFWKISVSDDSMDERVLVKKYSSKWVPRNDFNDYERNNWFAKYHPATDSDSYSGGRTIIRKDYYEGNEPVTEYISVNTKLDINHRNNGKMLMPLELWRSIPVSSKQAIYPACAYIYYSFTYKYKKATWLGKAFGAILVVVGAVLTAFGFGFIGVPLIAAGITYIGAQIGSKFLQIVGLVLSFASALSALAVAATTLAITAAALTVGTAIIQGYRFLQALKHEKKLKREVQLTKEQEQLALEQKKKLDEFNVEGFTLKDFNITIDTEQNLDEVEYISNGELYFNFYDHIYNENALYNRDDTGIEYDRFPG